MQDGFAGNTNARKTRLAIEGVRVHRPSANSKGRKEDAIGLGSKRRGRCSAPATYRCGVDGHWKMGNELVDVGGWVGRGGGVCGGGKGQVRQI